MRLELDVQYASRSRAVPAAALVRRWVRAALAGRRARAALGVRLVDRAEGRALNARYRGRRRPTNVLSFGGPPPPVAPEWLGDLVLCAPVVNAEARAQGKAPEAHWAHLVIHGTLHLLGHDHRRPREAARMEDIERAVLARLGFPDPYTPRVAS